MTERDEPVHGLRCLECAGLMVEVERQGVTVDRCQRCGSLWFDPGEIDRHAAAEAETRHSRSVEFSLEDQLRYRLRQVKSGDPIPSLDTGGGGLCPRCFRAVVEPGDLGTVEFWMCPSCRGTFLGSDDVLDLKLMVDQEVEQELRHERRRRKVETAEGMIGIAGLLLSFLE